MLFGPATCDDGETSRKCCLALILAMMMKLPGSLFMDNPHLSGRNKHDTICHEEFISVIKKVKVFAQYPVCWTA